MLGEGEGGLMEGRGGEDGALSTGILLTDNTQLKYLEGNPWVPRPIVSHLVSEDGQPPTLG